MTYFVSRPHYIDAVEFTGDIEPLKGLHPKGKFEIQEEGRSVRIDGGIAVCLGCYFVKSKGYDGSPSFDMMTPEQLREDYRRVSG